jgi:hypothetical protein
MKLCPLLKGKERYGLKIKLEILTTVNVKITVSCYMTPRSLVKRFRGTCFFYIQITAVSSAVKMETAGPHHTNA